MQYHSRSTGFRLRGAFTLIELLVVIAIVATLVALLLPTLASAKSAGRTAKCLSQQRQIGVTLAAYTNESGEWWPISSYAFCNHPEAQSALWTGVVAHYGPFRYITEYPQNAATYPVEAVFTSYGEQNKPNQGILKCPSDIAINFWGGPISVSYAYNGTGWGLGVNDYFTMPHGEVHYGVNGQIYADIYGRQKSPWIIKPADTVVLADVEGTGGYEYAAYRLSNWAGAPGTVDSLAVYHTGLATNVLWVDGHAVTRKPETMLAEHFDRR